MTRVDIVKGGLTPGLLAGLIGGLAYGAALNQLKALPTVAMLVGSASPGVGFAVALVIAVIVGAGFGVLVWQQHPGPGETIFWGVTYGAVLWFVGPLTLQPVLMGDGLDWNLRAAQTAFPSLVGQLLYGAMIGLVYVGLRREHRLHASRQSGGRLLGGALAGLLSGGLLGIMLDSQHQLLSLAGIAASRSYALAWLLALALGVLAAVTFALLYPDPTAGAGVSLIRGTLFGFVLWALVSLTVIPLIAGSGLAWSVGAAQSAFPSLPAYVLFGAAVALFVKWLNSLTRLLFSDPMIRRPREGAGTEGLRSLAWGAAAGLVGGLIFTIVMVQIGFLPIVARLIGSTSAWTGFTVHLIIDFLIGASYGLLFRHQSFDLGSALGWGVSYGVFWWILGPLTLLPILLGTTPRWTIAVAAGLLPSLVGHIAYGGGLGITFYLLEARHRPWWIPRTQADAARAAARKQQLFTSAPAMWALVAVIALTLPVLAANVNP